MDNQLLILSPMMADIQKGRSDRNGLVQQIITYVRDGRTITRKQWVRSEFADHAKKNEEEKKDTLVHQEEKKNKARKKQQADEAEKKEHADNRSHIKHLRQEEKETHSEQVHHTIDRIKKLTKQESKQHEKDEKRRRHRDANKDKEKHSAYGQADQTKADNKQQQNASTGYTPPSKK